VAREPRAKSRELRATDDGLSTGLTARSSQPKAAQLSPWVGLPGRPVGPIAGPTYASLPCLSGFAEGEPLTEGRRPCLS